MKLRLGYIVIYTNKVKEGFAARLTTMYDLKIDVIEAFRLLGG